MQTTDSAVDHKPYLSMPRLFSKQPQGNFEPRNELIIQATLMAKANP